MIAAKDLKVETEGLLAARGFPINPHLPQIEELADLRPASPLQVRQRCLVLAGVCARAYGAPQPLVAKWIVSHGLRDACTSLEANFLDATAPTDGQRAHFQPQVESIWEFAWVLKIIPSIDHFQNCSENLVHLIPKPGDNPENFLASAEIRSHEELYREADRLFRIHWAVREASIRSRGAPNGLGAFVTEMRLQAINWTVRPEQTWDEVDVST